MEITASDDPDMENSSADGARALLTTRLREVLKGSGGPAKVARRAGVSESTLNKWVSGIAEPGALNLLKIAEATSSSLDYLVGRAGAYSRYGAEGAELVARFERLGSETDSSLPEGYVAIPRLDISASAGPGRAVVSVDLEAEPGMAFQQRWLRSLGVSPANAEFLEAVGDSMKPTIQDGDLMLIDRGFGDVLDALIYVFVRDGFVSVKRVQRLALGGLQLISDNPAYPTQLVRADEMDGLNIEGRVVWYGRAM